MADRGPGNEGRDTLLIGQSASRRNRLAFNQNWLGAVAL